MAEPPIDDYATPDEAINALERLDADEHRRLERLARNRSRGLRHRGWEDILNTAIERICSGSRRWRRRVPLMAFLAQTMRSVVDEFRDEESRDLSVPESNLLAPEGDVQISIFERVASSEGTPEEELIAKEALARIENLFADDAEGLGIVMARAEGYAPAETQELLDLTPTQYDSGLKRIRRRLLRSKAQEHDQ